MEVEKKGGGSFPSNYVTIHQLRQRWLQQQQSSSSLSLSPVISESDHRDDDDDDDVESSKKPLNDAVSAHSPPPAVTKTPSYNNKNKASSSSSNPNQQPPLSPISSSSGGGSKKKPQNDAVSPPPAKTKSTPSYNNNNNKPPQQNLHNEIVSKPLNETRFRKGFNPNRLLTPQKPKPKPEPELTDNVVVNDVTDQPISIDNKNQLSKKIKYKKTRNPKRVLPDQSLTGAGSLPQTDPKPELEVEAVVVVVVEKEQESRELGGRRKSNKKKESKMAPELEQVVVVEQQQQLRESRGRRDWDNKGVREFKDKTASFRQNKHSVGDNVVEPELEVEMEVEAVVVEKRQKPRETRGRRDWDKKAVRGFKPKTASFGQYDYNNSNVDTNDDVGGGGGGVEAVDKVVGDGDVVKENSRRGSGKFDHQGQGQGKQSLKAASFDHDQDMSETAVKESDAVIKRGSRRFSGQGIWRPLPLIATSKGKVWVKKGESTTPN